MYKIRKGDTVELTKGKDKGKKGRVVEILSETNRAVVEGVNLVKKHKRQTKQDQQGGIISIEAPINISNLKVVCKQCNKGAKVGFVVGKDGSKSRICKSCKGEI